MMFRYRVLMVKKYLQGRNHARKHLCSSKETLTSTSTDASIPRVTTAVGGKASCSGRGASTTEREKHYWWKLLAGAASTVAVGALLWQYAMARARYLKQSEVRLAEAIAAEVVAAFAPRRTPVTDGGAAPVSGDKKKN